MLFLTFEPVISVGRDGRVARWRFRRETIRILCFNDYYAFSSSSFSSRSSSNGISYPLGNSIRGTRVEPTTLPRSIL